MVSLLMCLCVCRPSVSVVNCIQLNCALCNVMMLMNVLSLTQCSQ